MRLGISKKLIGAHGIGLALFLILAIFSYKSLNSFSSIQKKADNLAGRMELVSSLQLLIEKILMPPNDYLITGDKKEREIFAHLVTEAASLFEKIRISGGRTKEEMTIEEEVEKGFIELQQKAMVILSTENPIANKEAARLMEDMDAFGKEVEDKAEKFHSLIEREREANNRRASETKRWTYITFTSLSFVSIAGMVLLIFLIRRGVAGPLLELIDAAKVIGQGNLEQRVKIETGDEIEGLGKEFNDMAYSLKEKIDEVKEYSGKLEMTNRQLDQNILQLYALYSISKSLATTFEMEKLLDRVVEGVSRALKLHRINVMLVSADKTEMYIVSGAEMPDKAREARFKLGEGIYGRVAVTGNPEVINNPSKHPMFQPTEGLDDDVSSLICAPFKGRGQIIGVINAYRLGGEAFDDLSYELMIAAANQIGVALENARLFEETRILAITDGMTSLYNYRHFTERLNEEFERARRYKRDFSLIMIDIDFFKKYNDTHGHPNGDKLLREFSGILKRIMRHSDFIARYGGEEFVVILPETGKEMAVEAAEKIRKWIESEDFEGGETQPGGRVTVSLGVASYSEALKSADDLVKSADNALYRAKEEGRNRVSAFALEPEECN